MRARLWIVLLLVAGTFAVFGQVRHHEFVNYDDPLDIEQSPVIEDVLTPSGFARAFATVHDSNWIPVTWISFGINHALHGYEPAGYLLGNVALHALSAVLLFLALARLTGSLWSSAFVAAVFAVHPLHVESVAWAAERKDALSGTFFMLTLYAYAGAARRGSAPGRAPLVIAWLTLGLLSKPMLVTTPFVLLLLDYWPLRRLRADGATGWPEARRLRSALLEKLPLFALAAGAAGVTYWVQQSTGAMDYGERISASLRAMNALESTVAYLAQAVWPRDLAVFYPHPLRGLEVWRAVASGVGLLAASGLALRLARRQPWLLMGWLWFLGMLVPVIGLVQVGGQARADRYMYLPLIGLTISLAWAANQAFGARRRGRAVLALAASVALLVLGIGAWRQVAVWKDTRSLFEQAVAATERNFVAHRALADTLRKAGLPEDAEHHYRAALAARPGWVDARLELASLLEGQGRAPEAIDAYRLGLRLDPRRARAQANLGLLLLQTGQTGDATLHLERALSLHVESDAPGPPGTTRFPDERLAALHLGLAQSLFAAGRDERAQAHYRRGLQLAGENAAAAGQFGLWLLRRGQFQDAVEPLERALAEHSDVAELHAGRAAVALQLGDPAVAIRHSREALRLEPDYTPAANNLAWILATSPDDTLRSPAEAVALAEPLVLQNPDDPSSLDTLAASYASAGRFAEARDTADRGVALAEARGQSELAAEIRSRRALYRSGRFYRDPAPDRGLPLGK